MKVLHVYKSYFPDAVGGIEQAINQIARSTLALGVDPVVLSTISKQRDRTIIVDGHLSHQTRANFKIASTPFSMSILLKFFKLAKKADIIHYHFPYPIMDLMHFACRVKKPSLVTYHSDVIKQKYLLKLYQPLLKCFLSSVDVIVATSQNYFQTSNILQSFKNKTRIIPIGLNKTHYKIPDDSLISYWKKLFPGKFFLFIGVLRYYKGLHILIEAAKSLDYPIILIGSGPIEKELQSCVKKLNIKNIHFVGQIDNNSKSALLTLCYAIVFPSDMRSEAFGISLLEGAMFGKPMISSEIGTGTSFINIDKVTGLIIPPQNPIALRQAMQYLWQRPQEAAAMGRRAEERYWRFFNADEMGKSYYDLYKSLI